MQHPIEDPILGMLAPSTRFPGAWEGHLVRHGRDILLHIDPDENGLDATLAQARLFVGQLEPKMHEAYSALTAEFLGTYNEHWREDDEPKLTADEFVGSLAPSSIHFVGSGIEVMFNDGGLFGGHSLVAATSTGLTFDSATLFG